MHSGAVARGHPPDRGIQVDLAIFLLINTQHQGGKDIQIKLRPGRPPLLACHWARVRFKLTTLRLYGKHLTTTPPHP